MEHLRSAFRVGSRRTCRLVKVAYSTYWYKSRAKDITALVIKLKELAASRPRYGYRRLYELLRREGWKVNHKKVHRLYVNLGLQVRIKRKIRRASLARVPIGRPENINERWSMDFMMDVLDNGRRFRIFTIIDHFSRECPLLAADYSLTAQKVASYLDQLALTRGLPKVITVDNGTEFISRAMDGWAYRHGVKLDFIRPGKPVDNAIIESFNGKLRDECLNTHVFSGLEDVRQKLECWRRDYNTQRPHSSIGNLSPTEFVRQQNKGPQKAKILNLQTV